MRRKFTRITVTKPVAMAAQNVKDETGTQVDL
jgi:hypothetical protein